MTLGEERTRRHSDDPREEGPGHPSTVTLRTLVRRVQEKGIKLLSIQIKKTK